MKVPVKFVSKLEEEQREELNETFKNSKQPQTRRRAQAILLSSQGYCIDEIAKISNVNRNAVSSWIDRWEQTGIKGLEDKPRSGNPGILTGQEQELVIQLAQENPRSISKIIALLQEQTGKRVSETTIKRILKAAQLIWKRIKKAPAKKRDEKEFEAASDFINELRQQHERGEIELWYFDESGFDLQPTVPYAWQLPGVTIKVPSQKSKRLNVLGFLTLDNRFDSFCFDDGYINSDIVVAGFERFVKMGSDKPRVVLMDNAPIHTSEIFQERLEYWEKQGVVVQFLPNYCPELNKIEILWRFIKYHWLPFSAYLSFRKLKQEVENILKPIGAEFKIQFAS